MNKWIDIFHLYLFYWSMFPVKFFKLRSKQSKLEYTWGFYSDCHNVITFQSNNKMLPYLNVTHVGLHNRKTILIYKCIYEVDSLQ